MAGLKFLLDANVVSELTRPRANPRVLARFKRFRAQVCTAAPVLHELVLVTRNVSDFSPFQALRVKDWMSG